MQLACAFAAVLFWRAMLTLGVCQSEWTHRRWLSRLRAWPAACAGGFFVRDPRQVWV